MPMTDKLLTDRAIRNAGPGTHNDGNGLTLRVGKGNKRSWVLRYTWDSKAANLGLGSYPIVGLKEARALAAERRGEIAEGSKPTGARAAAAANRPEPVKPAEPTFREIATQVIEFRRPSWSSERHATQWTESLTLHAFPVIGDMAINEIGSADILNVLTPIWNCKAETATRVKQRMESVFDHAIAAQMRVDNPVSAVGKALPRRPRLKEHHPALAYGDVPAAVAAIRQSTANPSTRLALEFVILTAARAGEVRGMTWAEIDGNTWTVPAARMKMRRPHRVPLSGRCMEILAEARADSDSELVFPGSNGKPLSNMAFTMLLRRLDLDCVTHGFRSSFKDWCLAETSAPWAVSEAALAHNLGNSMEAAYARTDLFDRRRALMDEWADFVPSTAMNWGEIYTFLPWGIDTSELCSVTVGISHVRGVPIWSNC